MTYARGLVVSLALALAGCGAKDGGWQRISVAEVKGHEAQVMRAVAAQRDLATQLFARLQAAVKADGPAQAIDVCRTAAPEIAKQVGATHSLAIGRTSFQLRNPANAPPAWAKDYVAARTAEIVYLVHGDGRFAALQPILLQVGCLGCHGSPEQIKPDVRTALAERYPDDKATGFATGDLRGWFWIEVPPKP